MIWLIISGIINIIILIAAIIIIFTRQPKLDGSELVVVSETIETGVLGVFTWLLGIALVIMKYINPGLSGSDLQSYQFIAIFSILCSIIGHEILMYAYVKKIVVYDDRLEHYNLRGIKKAIYWKDIKKVKSPFLSKRVTFKTDKTTISINGAPSSYKKFATIAEKKIPKTAERDELNRIFSNWKD